MKRLVRDMIGVWLIWVITQALTILEVVAPWKLAEALDDDGEYADARD